MPNRLPPIPPGALTDEQREAVAQFREARGAEIFGPFVPLLRSPELLTRVSALGEYLRYHNTLPRRVCELAILITARRWSETYEWDLHSRIAVRAGVSLVTIKAIAEDCRPKDLPDDEDIVYRMCTELHREQAVSDETYARAVEAFGEQGVVEIVGLCGYYAMLAMVLNTASGRTPGMRPPDLKIPAL